MKHNRAVQKPVVRKPKVVNIAGGEALEDSARMALYKQVATSLWNGDGYYETHADWQTRFRENIQAVVNEGRGEWAFKLACYARDLKGLKLRSTPIALLAELSMFSTTQGLAKKYTPRIVLRGDEPADVLAYVAKFHTERKSGSLHTRKTWPHALIKGLQATLPKFDEYQLAKYKGEGNQIKLRDVFRIVRPHPVDDAQRALWSRAVRGELAVPYTWETQLSASKDKTATWNELIASGKLGTFALLRNLRNIQMAGANLEDALAQFTEDRVKRSGILPFQWYRAYNELDHEAQTTIVKCVDWSVSEISPWPGKTLVCVDHSGSMGAAIGRGTLSRKSVGDLLGAMAARLGEGSKVLAFGTKSAWCPFNTQMSIVWNTQKIGIVQVGHSTEAHTIFPLIGNEVFDRILLFSDMQCYGYGLYGRSLSDSWKHYRKDIAPNCRLYSINLASEDNSTQFDAGEGVVSLAGFSEQIFNFVNALERDDSILDWIEKSY